MQFLRWSIIILYVPFINISFNFISTSKIW